MIVDMVISSPSIPLRHQTGHAPAYTIGCKNHLKKRPFHTFFKSIRSGNLHFGPFEIMLRIFESEITESEIPVMTWPAPG